MGSAFGRTDLCVIVVEAGVYDLNGVRFDARVTEPTRIASAELQGVATDIEPVMAAVSIAGISSPSSTWPTLSGQSLTNALADRRVQLDLHASTVGAVDNRTERIALIAINTDGDAARFAEQAGWGGHTDELRELARTGYRDWLDQQLTEPTSRLLPYMEFIADDPFRNAAYSPAFASSAGNNRWDIAWNLTTPWMRNLLWEPDQLRQRVAFSLSQIFVVSALGSELKVAGASLADYYDHLATHALGNFRDLLSAVTYHPAMAYYLTYAANRPPSADGTRQPDENYAREIMQLFTIGLWQLNIDGSLKLANDGEGFVQRDGQVGIPTYDNDDVNILARVFTGLFYDAGRPFGATVRNDSFVNSYHWSGRSDNAADIMYQRYPLAMFEAEHDHDAKRFFDTQIPATSGNGITTIPTDRTQITSGGLVQIEAALDVLFNHPNVGPFIGRRLIQSLVTSNPSPAYIQRVAEVFNDDGTGVRGNLHAVASQILLDPEARDYFPDDPQRGKIVEPLVRIAAMAKAFRLSNNSRELEAIDAPVYYTGRLVNRLQQGLLQSPSVFNFFSPDFEIEEGVRAPEAEILTPLSVSGREELAEDLLFHADRDEPNPSYVQPDFTEELALLAAGDQLSLGRLLDRLDVLIAHGQLTDAARVTIAAAINAAAADPASTPRDQLRVATILTAMSPDANVLL